MGLEAEGFISDLDPTAPAGGDRISQGDDHIRLIKKDLLNTFPNVTGEVTVTHEELNQLAGVDQPIVDLIQIGDDAVVALDIRITKNETDIAQNTQDIADLRSDFDDHRLADHADVDTSFIKQGDVLIWDGGKWVAGRPSGGSVIKLAIQPGDNGDFVAGSNSGGSKGPGTLKWVRRTGSNETVNFPVPAGLKFCLQSISVNPIQAGYDPTIYLHELDIDGTKVFQNWGSSVTDLGPDMQWPHDGSTLIEVESNMSFQVVTNGYTAEVLVGGYFVEAY